MLLEFEIPGGLIRKRVDDIIRGNNPRELYYPIKFAGGHSARQEMSLRNPRDS